MGKHWKYFRERNKARVLIMSTIIYHYSRGILDIMVYLESPRESSEKRKTTV